MWTRLKTLAWWLCARLASPSARGALFRMQGARVGEGCYFVIYTLGSEPYLVEIGAETLVAGGVRFLTHDGGIWVIRRLRPKVKVNRFKPVRIGERCFIGTDSILLPGTDIGDDTIIGAGSVVTGKIPSGVVAAGVPARVIRTTQEWADKVEAETLWSMPRGRISERERRRYLVDALMTPAQR